VADPLISRTVALVMDVGEGQARPYCSGVWVSPNHILTAEHCLEESEVGDPAEYSIQRDVLDNGVERANMTRRPAHLVAKDAEHDLAMLRADFPPEHEFAFAGGLHDPYPGQFVQTMGHPRGLWYSYSSGEIAAVRKTDVGLDIFWIQSTAPISGGNSGCGLFDSDNRLIGIASRQFTRGQQLNFFVHEKYVAEFVGLHARYR